MNKDGLLLISSIVITLLLSLEVIRWVAPRLSGVPTDLQLVQIDKKVPPFFENVFRREDREAKEYLVNDPVTRVRARSFFPDLGGMGPNDLLGFRNYSVPNSANIVVIGDSQSYGNNARIEQNWPSFTKFFLKEKNPTIYNISVGGWAAVQYFDMFTKALIFNPKVIVIAFYSGNDPLETFHMVYGNPYWKELIPNNELTSADSPSATFPAPEDEWWTVNFKDGVKTVFTPTLRLSSNLDHPVIHAAYAVMADVAKRISEKPEYIQSKVVFTIIPTKELVYKQKVELEKIKAPIDYTTLVSQEHKHIKRLEKQIKTFPSVDYVDVIEPLQQAALQAIPLYPENIDGHPVAAGYKVVGQTIAKAIDQYLLFPPNGLVALQIAADQYQYFLIKHQGIYIFPSIEMIEANGWPPGEVPTVQRIDISGIPVLGTVDAVNPELFGPGKVTDNLD